MITKNRILFILGLWIVLVPFLGFPTLYKNIFTLTAGIIAVVLAFLYAREKRLSADFAQTQTSSQVSFSEKRNDKKNNAPVDVYSESYPVFTSLDEDEEDLYVDTRDTRNRSRNVGTSV